MRVREVVVSGDDALRLIPMIDEMEKNPDNLFVHARLWGCIREKFPLIGDGGEWIIDRVCNGNIHIVRTGALPRIAEAASVWERDALIVLRGLSVLIPLGALVFSLFLFVKGLFV